MTSLTLPLVFDMSRVHLTDEQFYQLYVSNPEIPLERNAQGALIVVSPTHSLLLTSPESWMSPE